MKEQDKKAIVARYNERLAEHGGNVEALACGGRDRQQLRFAILAEIADLSGATILDVGCGFGDFLEYLDKKKIAIGTYKGVEINPDLIAEAKRRYVHRPETIFEVVDVTEEGFDERYDYVVAGSTFNNVLNEGNMAFLERTLPRLFSLARKGVSINFQTDYVDFKRDDLFYYNPEKVFSLCKSITKRVTLRHDYPLYDFTVYLYPDFEGWGR